MTDHVPLDTRFQWMNRVFRVSSTGVNVVVGTLISVTGVPKSHTDICIITKAQFADAVKL